MIGTTLPSLVVALVIMVIAILGYLVPFTVRGGASASVDTTLLRFSMAPVVPAELLATSTLISVGTTTDDPEACINFRPIGAEGAESLK